MNLQDKLCGRIIFNLSQSFFTDNDILVINFRDINFVFLINGKSHVQHKLQVVLILADVLISLRPDQNVVMLINVN